MIVRRADLKDALRVAEIHTLSWQTAFSGIMPDDFLAEQNIENRKIGWMKNIREHPGSLLVIENVSLGILGFSCCGKVMTKSKALGFDGEVFGIHVDPTTKGQGYGTRLMAESFAYLKSIGCNSACLWTLEENIYARRFYENLGGKIICKQPVNFGGKELVEIAYGWNTLN